MEIKKIKELVQKVGIFRLLLLVIAGVVLLVLSLPSGEKVTEEPEVVVESSDPETAMLLAMERYAKHQEEATARILSKVEGIGDVEVMLTLASSEEKITLKNSSVTEDSSTQEDSVGGKRTDSGYQSAEDSILVGRDGEESPYVVQIHSPVIEGVVVVAEGVNSSRKEKEIIEAIQALFPIEPHKIKVMKMD